MPFLGPKFCEMKGKKGEPKRKAKREASVRDKGIKSVMALLQGGRKGLGQSLYGSFALPGTVTTVDWHVYPPRFSFLTCLYEA